MQRTNKVQRKKLMMMKEICKKTNVEGEKNAGIK